MADGTAIERNPCPWEGSRELAARDGVPKADPVAPLAEGSERWADHGPDDLIEVLHQLQERHGWLDERTMALVAEALNLRASGVYGVVSFYHLFRRRPPRPHACRLCQGTACVVQGGWELRRQLEQELSAGDWELTLESCLGVCGQAPMLLLDGVLVGKLPGHDPGAVRKELQRRGLPLQAGGLTP